MDHRRRVAMIALLAALLVMGLAACNSQSSNGTGGTGTPTSAAGTQGATSGSGGGAFKGIFQFADSPQVDDPYLTGGVVIHYWDELEPADGQFNWAPLDRDIATWTSHGKKVVVRIPFSSSFHDLNATPRWVYQLGVPSVTEVDGAVHPQYWNPIFLEKAKAFIAAYGARYDGNPNIVFIDAALGNDGESIVDNNGSHSHTTVNTSGQLPLWQGVGYTDQIWWQTIQTLMSDYKASFTRTPMAIQVVRTFIGGTKGYNAQKLLAYAAQQGFWLQSDGEYPTKTTLDPLWFKSTLVLEPGENSRKQGSTLLANLQNMMHLGASYVFVFGSDIKDQTGQQALQWAVSQKG